LRKGHGPAGAIGVATDYNQMMKWVLSFALVCGAVSQSGRTMSNTKQYTVHTYHKEEAESQIKVDQADRLSLRNTLDVCINPLDDVSHPDDALMNIITGQIAHSGVNADDAISIGQRAMKDFRGGRPGSFYDSLGKLIVTMDVKKHVLVGNQRVYDQILIYARVIGLLASSRSINFDDVLAYELAANAHSMFNPDGEIKTAKSKSILKQKLFIMI
jgi:hypothetical protein